MDLEIATFSTTALHLAGRLLLKIAGRHYQQKVGMKSSSPKWELFTLQQCFETQSISVGFLWPCDTWLVPLTIGNFGVQPYPYMFPEHVLCIEMRPTASSWYSSAFHTNSRPSPTARLEFPGFSILCEVTHFLAPHLGLICLGRSYQ